MPGWYQHHHFLPTEWLKLPAPLAENSGLKQSYHPSEYSLSNPIDPISILLYPGRLPCVASINQGPHCLPDADWVWPMGGLSEGWHGMDEREFGCLFPSSLLSGLHDCSGYFLWYKPSPSPGLDGQNPSVTCHDSAWMRVKDDSCWLGDIVSMTSPSKDFSYLCLNVWLVSSQGCMGKWLITQSLSLDRHILYNYHGEP